MTESYDEWYTKERRRETHKDASAHLTKAEAYFQAVTLCARATL